MTLGKNTRQLYIAHRRITEQKNHYMRQDEKTPIYQHFGCAAKIFCLVFTEMYQRLLISHGGGKEFLSLFYHQAKKPLLAKKVL